MSGSTDIRLLIDRCIFIGVFAVLRIYKEASIDDCDSKSSEVASKVENGEHVDFIVELKVQSREQLLTIRYITRMDLHRHCTNIVCKSENSA